MCCTRDANSGRPVFRYHFLRNCHVALSQLQQRQGFHGRQQRHQHMFQRPLYDARQENFEALRLYRQPSNANQLETTTDADHASFSLHRLLSNLSQCSVVSPCGQRSRRFAHFVQNESPLFERSLYDTSKYCGSPSYLEQCDCKAYHWVCGIYHQCCQQYYAQHIPRRSSQLGSSGLLLLRRNDRSERNRYQLVCQSGKQECESIRDDLWSDSNNDQKCIWNHFLWLPRHRWIKLRELSEERSQLNIASFVICCNHGLRICYHRSCYSSCNHSKSIALASFAYCPCCLIVVLLSILLSFATEQHLLHEVLPSIHLDKSKYNECRSRSQDLPSFYGTFCSALRLSPSVPHVIISKFSSRILRKLVLIGGIPFPLCECFFSVTSCDQLAAMSSASHRLQGVSSELCHCGLYASQLNECRWIGQDILTANILTDSVASNLLNKPSSLSASSVVSGNCLVSLLRIPSRLRAFLVSVDPYSPRSDRPAQLVSATEHVSHKLVNSKVDVQNWNHSNNSWHLYSLSQWHHTFIQRRSQKSLDIISGAGKALASYTFVLIWLLSTAISFSVASYAHVKGQPTTRNGEGSNGLRRLNHFVRHFEPVVYDHHDLHARHERVRRAAAAAASGMTGTTTASPAVLHLQFRSHNRAFHLRLRRDTGSAFSERVHVEDAWGRRLEVNTHDHLYSGEIVGERDSYVFGSIHDGVFQGRIESPRDQEHYYVERAAYHRQAVKKEADSFTTLGPEYHSIMYAASNVDMPDQGEGRAGCGAADDSTRRWMETVANSAVRVGDQGSFLGENLLNVDYQGYQFSNILHGGGSSIEQSKQLSVTGHSESSVRQALTKLTKAGKRLQYFTKDKGHNDDESRSSSSDRLPSYLKPHFEELKFEDDEDFQRTLLLEEHWKRRRSSARTSHTNSGGGTQQRYYYSENPLNKYTRTPHATLASTANKRVCNLFVQTDTFLWEHILSTGKDSAKAREEISSLIAQHVEAASRIYKNTDFNGIKDIKFTVQRIRINDTSACQGANRLTNPFCAANLDASNFLNLNSLANHDDFCLAYVWTFRDFQHGTLGLAWVASVNGASGGICEKYKTYSENNNGRSENVRRSLNTGIITFLNHNAKIPLKVSEITFAHEIGHNFGSPHDFPARCVPGGHNGNYIMYASATQGHQPNNQRFSDCSIANISNVLHAIFKGEQKENCFQEYEGPFCGNKIVEGHEECDCGYDERECDETCCYARDNTERVKGCTRRPFAHCSPSEGPCCNLRCEFETPGKPCRLESDCTHVSFCRGNSAHCPQPSHKENKTECNNGTQVCWNGECSGSICHKYNLEECFLTENFTPDPDKLCEVACQQWNRPDTCRSTFEIEAMRHISGIKRRPGSPCNNFHGYCDVFQKCRNVDAEGPLARLKRLLFNKQSLHSVRQWVTLNWWAVLVMMVSLVITMACFIRCCAVHTPSSNPRMPPALRIADTLRRPGDTFKRRKRYVPPVEQNGPPPPYPGVGGALVATPSAPPGPTIASAATASVPPTASVASGPSHGYGHGRGHYNRSQQTTGSQRSGQQSGKAKKSAKPAIEMQHQLHNQQHAHNSVRNQRV